MQTNECRLRTMNVLIVYAHHESASFCGAMLRTATAALRAAGHTVVVSDLYAMGFDPVSDRRNFTTVADTTRLRQQTEEAHAHQEGGFAPALHTEMHKLVACDLLILLFPIWWLGLPAILKGWVDRVFAVGVAYGGGRCFGSGVMRGKRAMCVLSTGACPLRTTARVTTRRSRPCFTRCIAASSSSQGLDVLPPFVAHGPDRINDGERAAMLESVRARIAHIAAFEPLASVDKE